MNLLNKRVITLAAALTIGLSMPAISNARPGDNDRNDPTFQLTEEQRASLTKIMDEIAPGRQEMRANIEAKRAELKREMASASPDRAKIMSLTEEIGALRGKEMAQKAKIRMEIQKEGLPDSRGARDKKHIDGRRARKDFQPKLNSSLSPEQKAVAEKILADNADARKKLADALAARREELKRVMTQSNPDTSKIEALSREIGSLRGRQIIDRLDLRANLANAGLGDQVFERPDKPAGSPGHHGGKRGHGGGRDHEKFPGEGR